VANSLTGSIFLHKYDIRFSLKSQKMIPEGFLCRDETKSEKRKHKNSMPSVKHVGGSVMVWTQLLGSRSFVVFWFLGLLELIVLVL